MKPDSSLDIDYEDATVQEVYSFFIQPLNYVTKMFPRDDAIVNNAIVLDVGNRSKATFENVYALLDRFPGIVEEDEVRTLENKILKYQLLDDSELPDTSHYG